MIPSIQDLLRYLLRDSLMAELDLGTPDFCGGIDCRRDKRRTPGAVAVEKALELWGQKIKEPQGAPNQIDDFIRGDYGLGWSTADAINWTPHQPYTHNGQFQWCGAFAAYCWGHAGLKASIRKTDMASTWRLYKWAGLNGSDPSGRVVTMPGDLLPGDILVVSRGKKKQGEHICLVERVDHEAKLIHTIEGNARGVGPDGTVYEGVVKRTRPWPKSKGGLGRRANMRCPVSGLSQTYEGIWAYRPLDDDLT